MPPKPVRDYSSLLSKEPKSRIKEILIAQPPAARSPYFDLEKKYGVKVTFRPFVTIEGVSSKEFRKQRIVIQEYNGVVFTSQNAIDHYFRTCDEMRVKVSQETKFFCTSEAIALYLQKYTQYRKRKVFFSDSNSNKELRNLIMKHKDSTRFLYICSQSKVFNEITSFMTDNKVNFAEAVMYKAVPIDLRDLNLKKYDMLLLFSPTGLSALQQSFPNFEQGKLKIGVYGRTTADAMISENLKIHLMAPLESVPSLTVALQSYLVESNK